MKQQIEILDKSCTVYQRGDVPQMLLLQLVDEHDREELDTEMEWIVSHSTVDFRFIAVHVDRWFDELAPWPAPPVFGKTPFGNGATKTLDSLRQIAGEEQQRMAASVETPIKVIIGGYSLAGLFALWAGYQSDQPFDAVVAASPSVWYQDWLDYAAVHQPQSDASISASVTARSVRARLF